MFLILEVSAMIITGTVALISKLLLRSFLLYFFAIVLELELPYLILMLF